MPLRHLGVIIAEMGSSTPFERRLLDWLSLSQMIDQNVTNLLRMTLPARLILYKPLPTIIPRFAVATAPDTAKERSWFAPTLTESRIAYEFKEANWMEAPVERIKTFMERKIRHLLNLYSDFISPGAIREEIRPNCLPSDSVKAKTSTLR